MISTIVIVFAIIWFCAVLYQFDAYLEGRMEQWAIKKPLSMPVTVNKTQNRRSERLRNKKRVLVLM